MKDRTTAGALRTLGEQLLDRLGDTAGVVATRAAELPGYSSVDHETRRLPTAVVGSWAVKLWFVDQRRPSDDEALVFTRLAEARAAQGVPLDAALRALQIAVTETWNHTLDIAHSSEVSRDVLIEFARRVADFQDFATAKIVDVYQQLERDAASREEGLRIDFLRSLAQGALSPHELSTCAQQFGIRMDGVYVAIRAREGGNALGSLHRTIANSAAHLRLPAIVAFVDTDVIGVLDERVPIPATSGTIGVGPPTTLPLIAHSFTMAGRILDTATAFRRIGVHRLPDVGLLAAVVADKDISEWALRGLQPLVTVPRFGENLTDTLRVFFDGGMRIDATARRLGVHPNTLRHRLRRIADLTGADLEKTEDLFELWWGLRALEASGRADGAAD